MIRGQFVSLLAVAALSVCAVAALAIPVPVPIAATIVFAIMFLAAVAFLVRWTYIANYRRAWAKEIAGRSPPIDIARQGSKFAV